MDASISMTTNTRTATLLSLGLVLVLDGLVGGMVFPILGLIFIDPNQGMVPATASLFMRDLLYGLSLGSFFFFSIIGSALLGDLSDHLGRRKVLLLSTSTTLSSCLLSALALALHSVGLLIAARALGGIGAGNQGLAQAAIIDISTPEAKVRNLSLIGLASSIGFVVGPVMGGLFSAQNLFPAVNFTTPFLIASALALLNIFGLVFTFKETFFLKAQRKLCWYRGFLLVVEGFRHLKLRVWLAIFGLSQLAWGFYYLGTGLLLAQTHHYTASMIGFFMTYVSLVFAFGLSIVVPFATKRYSLRRLCLASLILYVLALTLNLIWVDKLWVSWLGTIPLVLAQSLLYTCLLTLISNNLEADTQGWGMGSANGLGYAAWGLASLSIGSLISAAVYLPFLGGLILIGSCIVLMSYQHLQGSKQ